MARSSDDDNLPSYWDSVKILTRELVNQYEVSEASALGPELLWTRPDIVAIFPPPYGDRRNSTESLRPRPGTTNDHSSRPVSSDVDSQPRTDLVNKTTPQTTTVTRVTPTAPVFPEETRQSDVSFIDYSPVESTYVNEENVVRVCNNPSLPHSSLGCVCNAAPQPPSANPIPLQSDLTAASCSMDVEPSVALKSDINKTVTHLETTSRPTPSAPVIPNGSQSNFACVEPKCDPRYIDGKSISSLDGAKSTSNSCEFKDRVEKSKSKTPELGVSKSQESTSLLPVKLTQDVFLIPPDATQTTIQWEPPANADDYCYISCRVHVSIEEKQNLNTEHWKYELECFNNLLRVYRLDDLVMIGRIRIKITDPGLVNLRLRIRAEGTEGVSYVGREHLYKPKSDGEWSDVFTIRLK